MLLFSHTLQGYGFSSDKMYVLLQELRENYNEVLMQKWVVNFRDIFDADNYHPIQVGQNVKMENTFPFFKLLSNSLTLMVHVKPPLSIIAKKKLTRR